MSEPADRDVVLAVEAYQIWVRAFNKYGQAKSSNCRRRHLRRWGKLSMTQKEEVVETMNAWLKEGQSG